MKTDTHKNAETLRQIFSVDDNKFNSTFTSNRTPLGEYEHHKHLLDKVEHVTKSLKCTIVIPPNYVDGGLELEFFRDNLDEIKSVLNNLGINTNNINKDLIDKQRIKGVEIIVSVKEENFLTQEEITCIDITKLKSRFSEMLQKVINDNKLKTNSLRRNNMKKTIKSGRFIKSGASTGYDLTIEGIELDTSKVEILEQDDDSVQVNVPVKPCVVDRWVAESYYERIDSNYNDGFFGNDDKRVDSGYVKMIIDIWENETVEDAIDAIPNVIDIKALYGWGWVHSNLPEEGVHFKYKDIKEPDIGAYGEIHIDEIELNCPNICMDINAFFANPEDYYDEIYNSRKPVTSGLTFRQAVQDFKAAGQWNDYYEMQQDWEAYKDGLERDGIISEKTRSTWGNPCTPEGFKKWNK